MWTYGGDYRLGILFMPGLLTLLERVFEILAAISYLVS